MVWPSWPGPQPTVTIEYPVPPLEPVEPLEPAPPPTPSYSASTGWHERFRQLEHQVHQLAREVDQLQQQVTALQQQQQQPVRRRWYQRLTVETCVRNRAIIRAQRRPCARCGGPIAYDQPYWLIGPTGQRKVNAWAFHCGHVVSRHRGGGHAFSNLQAEHAGCSIRDGARESNGHNGPVIRLGVIPNLDTSTRW